MRHRRTAARTEIYRFVVVYIYEGREIQGTPEVWRGHVTHVSGGLTGDEAASRVVFEALDELPGILRNLLTASGAPCPPVSPPEDGMDQGAHPPGARS